MKIVNLLVENFRAINRVELSDLQDMVVIAGPNGCGKSCILDSIRLFKSVYGGYLDKTTADIDASIDRARREIELLSEYRTRLIADVVTGQVDVRDAATRLSDEAETLIDAEQEN